MVATPRDTTIFTHRWRVCVSRAIESQRYPALNQQYGTYSTKVVVQSQRLQTTFATTGKSSKSSMKMTCVHHAETTCYTRGKLSMCGYALCPRPNPLRACCSLPATTQATNCHLHCIPCHFHTLNFIASPPFNTVKSTTPCADVKRNRHHRTNLFEATVWHAD